MTPGREILYCINFHLRPLLVTISRARKFIFCTIDISNKKGTVIFAVVEIDHSMVREIVQRGVIML